MLHTIGCARASEVEFNLKKANKTINQNIRVFLFTPFPLYFSQHFAMVFLFAVSKFQGNITESVDFIYLHFFHFRFVVLPQIWRFRSGVDSQINWNVYRLVVLARDMFRG